MCSNKWYWLITKDINIVLLNFSKVVYVNWTEPCFNSCSFFFCLSVYKAGVKQCTSSISAHGFKPDQRGNCMALVD